MYDVCVVGGGVAGLMTAKLLSDAGKKILLLEARDQLGGRIYRVQDLSFPAEGGAEFIHGNLQTTFDLLKEAGLKKQKLKGNFCIVKNGKWSMNTEIFSHWELLMKKLIACKEDITVEKFLAGSFREKRYEALKEQFKKYVEGYDAADIKYASLLAIKRELENESEDQYRPIPDYHAIISFLKNACLKNKAAIKTSEPVTQIRIRKSVEVISSLENYYCRKVVIAVPLGVLQSRKNSKGFINFPASLEDYTKAARRIGNGGVIKFLLEFDKAFWLDEDFLKAKQISAPSYIFSNAEIPTWWTQYPSRAPLLTGWIAGPSSYKMKNYSDKKFKSLLLQSLSAIFFVPITELDKRLINFKVMNWIKELHISGGYSYATLQTHNARNLMNTPFDHTFYFAGEYLLQNSSSTVDAALQSGQQVAAKILND